MKIYMATWLLEPLQGVILNKLSADNRLLSYHHTKEKKDELRDYINKTQPNRMGGTSCQVVGNTREQNK